MMIRRPTDSALENFEKDHKAEYDAYYSIAMDLQHESSRSGVTEEQIAYARKIEAMLIEAGVSASRLQVLDRALYK